MLDGIKGVVTLGQEPIQKISTSEKELKEVQDKAW